MVKCQNREGRTFTNKWEVAYSWPHDKSRGDKRFVRLHQRAILYKEQRKAHTSKEARDFLQLFEFVICTSHMVVRPPCVHEHRGRGVHIIMYITLFARFLYKAFIHRLRSEEGMRPYTHNANKHLWGFLQCRFTQGWYPQCALLQCILAQIIRSYTLPIYFHNGCVRA